MDITFSSPNNSIYEDNMSRNTNYKKGDISISDHLADFQRLRISALTKAAIMSPLVNEVTIGPNSPIKKDEFKESTSVKEDDKNEEDLIEDRVREDLRYTLIMKEYQGKLEEASDMILNNMLDKMSQNRAPIMERCRRKHSEECKRRVAEMRNIQLQKELRANDNWSILEKAKLDEQKSQSLNRQRQEDMNRQLEEQNKARARLDSISDSRIKIDISYYEIISILNIEPYGKIVCDKYITSINTVVTSISTIMDLCNTDATTDKEVKQAEVLALNMNNIKNKIVEDLNEIKQQELNEKIKEEELIKLNELEEKRVKEIKTVELAQVQKAISEQAKKIGPTFYATKNYNYYEHLRNFLGQYEAQYRELLENNNLKKFRFDCQKAVNTPVNALSSVSGSHMKDKYDKLSKLLKGERVQVLDTYVTASQHPQGLSYCTALLAKKIVRQGDLLVSSNPEAAFPLAAVTAALWSQFPQFGILLEAYFHKQCPYLVPMFLPQKEGQTDKEFYLSRGYTYNDEGVVEKQDKFLKRMSGIFRLRCAIWTIKMPKFINAPNPHGLRYGWQWLASFINLKPEPDICATLIYDFFTVCGSEFFKHYGKQCRKIITLINTDYFAILQNIDEGGPKTRLEAFLQNVLNTGHVQPPSGLLQANTW